jgi:hypothetical protein
MSTSELPAAEVVEVVAFSHTRDVYVSCPFCHRQHHHGWSWSDDSIGSRVAHCRAADDEPIRVYDILTPPTSPPRPLQVRRR